MTSTYFENTIIDLSPRHYTVSEANRCMMFLRGLITLLRNIFLDLEAAANAAMDKAENALERLVPLKLIALFNIARFAVWVWNSPPEIQQIDWRMYLPLCIEVLSAIIAEIMRQSITTVYCGA